MISSWKNFALLTGTGEKLNVLPKATAVKLRHHQGDPSVCHFEPVRCTQGKLRGEIFFLCLKTPEIYLANSEVHLDCAKNVRE